MRIHVLAVGSTPDTRPVHRGTRAAAACRGLFLAALLALTPVSQAAADPISIQDLTIVTAAQMVAALIGANPGVNVVAGSELYGGALAASGLFTGGTSILPFDSGLLLTTGMIAAVPGPNNDDAGADTDHGGAGNAALSAVIGGVDTFDAATLTFSFIPDGDSFSFQYVFGSEEYPEFTGGFDDVFAAFLDGVNIALLPVVGVPISVNSVNEGANDGFFTANPPDAVLGGPLNVQYDGLVGAGSASQFHLFASASVTPGQTYQLTLAIADATDGRLDSGVFISGGSFVVHNIQDNNDPPPNGQLPEPGMLLLAGMAAGAAAGRRLQQRIRG